MKDSNPLPNIDGLLVQRGRKEIHSALDLKDAFHTSHWRRVVGTALVLSRLVGSSSAGSWLSNEEMKYTAVRGIRRSPYQNRGSLLVDWEEEVQNDRPLGRFD